jgi:hypothetical protein
MEAGFYDETIVSALTALIFHEGICRGYITEASRVTYKIDRSFYETLKKKTIACDFFAIQFSRSHVGIHNDRYSLIDLEAVHPIKDLPKMQSLHAFFDDNDYGRFVTSRFLALYPGKRADLGDYYFLSKKTRTTVRNKILSALYPIRMLRIWQRQFQQWMNIKLRATHTHLIEL